MFYKLLDTGGADSARLAMRIDTVTNANSTTDSALPPSDLILPDFSLENVTDTYLHAYSLKDEQLITITCDDKPERQRIHLSNMKSGSQFGIMWASGVRTAQIVTNSADDTSSKLSFTEIIGSYKNGNYELLANNLNAKAYQYESQIACRYHTVNEFTAISMTDSVTSEITWNVTIEIQFGCTR
jgi:hypothetical protein